MATLYKLEQTYPGSPELGFMMTNPSINSTIFNDEESIDETDTAIANPKYWRKIRQNEFVMSVNIPVVRRNYKADNNILDKVISTRKNELSFEISSLEKSTKKRFKSFIATLDNVNYLEFAAVVDIEVANDDIIATIIFEHNKVLTITQNSDETIEYSEDLNTFYATLDSREHNEETAFMSYLWYSFLELSELHNTIHNYEPFQELTLEFLDRRTYAVKYLNEVVSYNEMEDQSTFNDIDVQSQTLYDLFEKSYYNMSNRI